MQFDYDMKLYPQVAEDIQKKVLRNDYPPGTPLPTARTLAKNYAVGVQTAAAAIDWLETLGLIRRVPFKGVFLKDDADKTIKKNNLHFVNIRWVPELVEKAYLSGLDFDGLVAIVKAEYDKQGK